MIKSRLGSLCEDCVFPNLNTCTNPVQVFSYSSSFYSPTWLLPGNTSWRIFVGCHNHHIWAWQSWQRSTTAFQHHASQRVGHGYPQLLIVRLLITPCLHSVNLVDLVFRSYSKPYNFSHIYWWYFFYLNYLLQLFNIPTLKYWVDLP